MTLLKREENEEKMNNQDMMKMEKFMQMVKETDTFFKKHTKKGLICVAAGKGKCNNPYVKFVAEYIFDSDLHIGGTLLVIGPVDIGPKGQQKRLFFNCKENDFSDSTKNEINRLLTRHFLDKNYLNALENWRDDIGFFRNNPNYFSAALSKYLRELEETPFFSSDKSSIVNEDTLLPAIKKGEIVGVWYMIFWNLFLTAIDDDIYNNQLSDVIDLAYIFKFDEPMIRDWCRAVEYVLNGNKLGKDCDLKCETDEGNYFFKHSLMDAAKMNK